MILQNFIIQTTALFLGIIAGSIVSWLAQEELEMHKNIIGNSARIVFMLTLLIPLLFTEHFMIIGFIAGTYCVVGIWQQKEAQIFFCLAPLAAILCLSSDTGFFIVLTAIFIATLLSTTILLTGYTKNQKIQWNRKMLVDGIKVYGLFVLFSIGSYILLSKNFNL